MGPGHPGSASVSLAENEEWIRDNTHTLPGTWPLDPAP